MVVHDREEKAPKEKPEAANDSSNQTGELFLQMRSWDTGKVVWFILQFKEEIKGQLILIFL